MYPKDDIFLCKKCGFEQKKVARDIILTKSSKKEVPILEHTVDILPKIKTACPKCRHNEAFWVLRQMRGSDEPETRFFTCTKCGFRWRE